MRKVLTILSLAFNFIFVILCTIGVYQIISPFKAGAIGIIGGEDGSTAIYVSSEISSLGSAGIIVSFFVFLLFEITIILNLRKPKLQNKL